MAVKFLQHVTSDVELNRVQNNVAEAFRHLEASVETNITNTFNSLTINNFYGGPIAVPASQFGGEVLRASLITSSNIYQPLLSFVVQPGQVKQCALKIMAKQLTRLINPPNTPGAVGSFLYYMTFSRSAAGYLAGVAQPPGNTFHVSTTAAYAVTPGGISVQPNLVGTPPDQSVTVNVLTDLGVPTSFIAELNIVTF